jgi:hypothetical protein
MKIARWLIWIVLLIAGPVTFFPAEASAQSAMTTKSFYEGLDKPQLAHLREDLLDLYMRQPELFEYTAATRRRVIEADRQRRGPYAHVAPIFRSLGPEALLPMLHAIATDEPLESGMPLRAWIAYRAGLIEAVGNSRDPRLAPVIWAVLEGGDTHPMIRRAAAEAIARLADEANTARLLEWVANAPVEEKPPLVLALGKARGIMAAEFLADILRQSDDQAVNEAATRALGDLANAWAWETPFLAKSGQAGRVKQIAFDALLEVYLGSAAPSLVDESLKSLMLVNVEDYEMRLAKRRELGGAGEGARIDALERRLKNNPLNRSRQSHD